MKSSFCLPLALAALLFGGTAHGAYTLQIDGRDSQSVEADLMIPLRAPAEELGYTVSWDNGKTVVSRDGTELVVQNGSAHYALTHTQKDGVVIDRSVDLAAAPYLKDNVTYVPADLFAFLLEDGQELTAEGTTTVTGGTAGAASASETAAEPGPGPEAAGETEAVSGEAGASGEDQSAPEETAAPAAESPAVEMANPFRNYDTLAEAEAAAGVSMTLPAIGENYNSAAYRAVPGQLLEVIYGSDGAEALRLRKGADLSNVSGDYGTYRTVKTIRVDGVDVRMKGEGNRMRLATWERDGHAYSVSAETPLTIAEMMGIVRETV